MSSSAWRRIGALSLLVVLLLATLAPTAAAAPPANGTITIPGSPSAVSQTGSVVCRNIYHRIVRGDNLTRIAARYGVTVRQLVAWNGIANPDRIYIGRVLLIRRCTSVPAPKPTPPPICIGCPPPPTTPIPIPNCWQATFYNSKDLTGDVAYSTCVPVVGFSWGWEAPFPGVNKDFFSARFTNSLSLAAGTWRITVRSDDGVRLTIDGIPIITQWQIQAPTTFTQDVLIQSTKSYNFTVEYFENDQHAEVYVWCQKLR